MNDKWEPLQVGRYATIALETITSKRDYAEISFEHGLYDHKHVKISFKKEDIQRLIGKLQAIERFMDQKIPEDRIDI